MGFGELEHTISMGERPDSTRSGFCHWELKNSKTDEGGKGIKVVWATQ